MIKCEQLSAGYGTDEIVHGVTWEGKPGKLTVIAGPNGSGKSTLLKTLMGQTKVFRGQVLLDELPIGQWSSREFAKRIAYLPQNRSEVNISVARMVLHGRFPYIVYPRHYTKEDQERVEQALEKMGIARLKDCLVSELSGGEKQKAYLAMALVQDAEIFILDEPTTYLDISCQLELMELLKMLSREGKTIIAVLHDLDYALQYADQMVVMEGGRKVFDGTPEAVLESGKLEEVFRLKIGSVTDEFGENHYWFRNL